MREILLAWTICGIIWMIRNAKKVIEFINIQIEIQLQEYVNIPKEYMNIVPRILTNIFLVIGIIFSPFALLFTIITYIYFWLKRRI